MTEARNSDNGFRDRPSADASGRRDKRLRLVGSPPLAQRQRADPIPADLGAVIDAWPSLPATVQAVIAAMVRAAAGAGGAEAVE